jgi:hypothetical protein
MLPILLTRMNESVMAGSGSKVKYRNKLISYNSMTLEAKDPKCFIVSRIKSQNPR